MSLVTATPSAGSVLQFVRDDRYTVGAFTSTVYLGNIEQHHTWQMPFLGWAVTVEDEPNGGYGTQIRPVFLQEDGGDAVTDYDVAALLQGRLVRLVPAEPAGLR